MAAMMPHLPLHFMTRQARVVPPSPGPCLHISTLNSSSSGKGHHTKSHVSTIAAGRGPAGGGGSVAEKQVPEKVKDQREKLQSLGGIVTDDSVPEGHKGLHGFLYGDDGSEVHDASASYQYLEGEDDGTTILDFDAYLSPREATKIAGVYGVYNSAQSLQYVGYSRNMILALKTHRVAMGDKCSFVRVKVVADAALITRTRLEEERQQWIRDEGAVPRGNGEELYLWEGLKGPGSAAMNEAERGEYEEKKLKMRKAMGENLFDAVEGETEDSKTRRMKLLQATEDDDWSSVINGQTSQTVVSPTQQPSPPPEHDSPNPDGQIVSPFAKSEILSSASSKNGAAPKVMELTVANVDEALNEVRPYLIADGGNVEVVGVEAGVVLLRLQGACGTCPSSTATMKMGIERSLKNTFGDALKEVAQVDKIETSASVSGVEGLLDTLRPALNNFKATVEVVSVDPLRGVCALKYKGPPPVGMGLQAAIKDKYPDIRNVKLLKFD